MKVSTKVCDTLISVKAFRLLADKVMACNVKEDVQTTFRVLAGELAVSSVDHLLTE